MVSPCGTVAAAAAAEEEVRRLRKSSRQEISVGPARKMAVGWQGCSSAGELGVNICSWGRDISCVLSETG